MSTSLDEDLIVLEDLDFEITCVMDQVKADWIADFKCCGKEAPVCDKCRNIELKMQDLWPKRVCAWCQCHWNAHEEDNIEWIKL